MALSATSSIDPSPLTRDGVPGRIFGTGEMADLVRAFDWSATSLGPIETWPETLLITVNTLLASRHPLFLWWGDELIQFYNDAYRPSLGFKHPRALGQRGQDCWHEVWDSIGPQIQSVLRGCESTWNVDQLLPIYRNGDQLEDAWWTFSYSPVLNASGQIAGIFVVVSETTGRVLAERELSRNRERLELTLESADLGTWSYDAATDLSTADPAMQRIFGSPRTSGDFAYWITFVHPDDRDQVGTEFAAAIAGQAPYESEYRIVRPDGTTRWIRSKGRVLIEADNPLRLFVVVEDITERKLAQIELHDRARDLRESQRIGKMGSWHLVLGTGELTWSEEVYKLMERDPSLPVMNYARQPEIIEPESGRRLQAAIDKCIATGQTYELDVKMYLASGKEVWLATRGEPIFGGDGKVAELRGTVRDITDRKLVEEALRTSEQRLQLALESASLGTWSYDAETGISIGDPAMQRIFGADRAAGDFHYWIEFAHPDDREAIGADFLAALSGDAPYETEYRIVRPTDREVRWIRSVGRVLREHDRPPRMLVVVEDITNRKLAEQVLLRTEKLAAVGRLASSIAHEINNPLESITNLLYLARNAEDLKQSREYLALADTELRRASAITSQTLRFHRQSTKPSEVTSDDLILNTLNILHSRILNANISVERRNRANRPVLCFDGEIRQVISNLLINAVDAMHPGGGRLIVRSREGHDASTQRPGLILTIADTGSGMSPQTLSRVFEPFYTTKGIAGTGLGLWISQDIIERHKGRLRVRSSQRPGHTGTVFTIFLPFQAATR